MTESNRPPRPEQKVRVYERLRHPGASLVTSTGIGVAILTLLATLVAAIVAIIW